MIDAAGFAAGYALLLLLPLATLWSARSVPRSRRRRPRPARPPAPPGTCCRHRACKRLLLVNWLLSMCWDVHSFAVPILGHERGFSASTIGLILGTFTLSVTGVRLLIPLLAHRLREAQVVRGAMLGTARGLRALPAGRPRRWLMAAVRAWLLGLTLGACSR